MKFEEWGWRSLASTQVGRHHYSTSTMRIRLKRSIYLDALLSVLCICNRRLIGPADFVRPDDGKSRRRTRRWHIRHYITEELASRESVSGSLSVRRSAGRLITIPDVSRLAGDGQKTTEMRHRLFNGEIITMTWNVSTVGCNHVTSPATPRGSSSRVR